MRDGQRRSTPVRPGPRTALATSGTGHSAGLSAEALSPPRPAIDTAGHVNKTVGYQRTSRPPSLRGPRSLAARTAVLRRGPLLGPSVLIRRRQAGSRPRPGL